MSRIPPDQAQRVSALDPTRSILVQAPAGSGKTDLLTRRFLRLLGEVDDPSQIVAITFTKAAAAEMRHRILGELERAAAPSTPSAIADDLSMEALAHRALDRSLSLGWRLPDLPAHLRILTIDSFCRELAIQQPLVSGFGNDLAIHEHPVQLYRRAARRSLLQISADNAELTSAIQDLLLWRDNNWQDLEGQLVEMLEKRDRWMHDFVLDRNPDWDLLRERLERPFHPVVSEGIARVNRLLDHVPQARDEALLLARFACEQPGGPELQELAHLPHLPTGPFTCGTALEEARLAFLCLAEMLLTSGNRFRRQLATKNGFPPERPSEKLQMQNLIARLSQVDGLESALVAIRSLPPARYTTDDWRIIRACFTLLRHAVAELHAVFAEAGAVDFTEVAQIAQRILADESKLPSDGAIVVADKIRHLLVDETQDTSRRQHRMLGSVAAAWSDQVGRTVFVVGDPMQSIYSFRDADAELFMRLRDSGLDIAGSDRLALDPIRLTANFRTAPALVNQLNDLFGNVFAADDGSGITFASAEPARDPVSISDPRLRLHVEFMPHLHRMYSTTPAEAERKNDIAEKRMKVHERQTAEIVDLIRHYLGRVDAARSSGGRYRIAVLGRARAALVPIAQALRKAVIPFRAVELEKLNDRPEVLDVLALGRALLNPVDRVAWLSLLRAPWCGLPLADLHLLTSADDKALLRRPVADLLAERLHLVSHESRVAVERVLRAAASAPRLRAALPTASLGTWLEQIWLRLGGASCVDASERANLDLLWSCLDSLPNGEQDFVGPALDSALEKLTALPDPAVTSDCGVQLMTIHKSKGLEFEVVIVPELQAGGATNRTKLLSWFERGVAEPGEAGEVTEFLVAPLQSKGADHGKAKAWVDRVYRERELQEMRRILYVAATRSREELHLLARLEHRDDNGTLSLVEPTNGLLATGWPAFEREIRARFEEWAAAQAKVPRFAGGTLPALAASGNNNLIAMPSPDRPTVLRRLAPDFDFDTPVAVSASAQDQALVGSADTLLYSRHEGGALSRALGAAVHKLLEALTHFRMTMDWEGARAALKNLQPRIKAQIRATGAGQSEATSIAVKALDYALLASNDPNGKWILSPRADAASEAAWVGVVSETLRSVRVDRVFRAGLEPLSEGNEAWWIVDYKTAHADDLGPLSAMSDLRSLFAPQLETYAMVLRNLHGQNARIRAALYYPRMSFLDWWEMN